MSHRPKRAEAELVMPEPEAIVRFYVDPRPIIAAYLDSEFTRQLATEHERQVRLVTEEGADVTDAASYARVGDRLVTVATHRREVESWFEPLVSLAYRLHRLICARREEVLAPLATSERTAKMTRLALERLEAQRRREEEQRLAEIARQEEQARLAREAELLEQRQEPELAAIVLEQAVPAPPPVISIASTLPATKGVSTREMWRWRPVGGDTREARARAVKLVPREFLDLNDKDLSADARAHGNASRGTR